MTLRELFVKIGFQVDDKALTQLNSSIDTFKSGVIGVGASIGVATASLYGLVKTTADAADGAWKMSQRVGIAVESLQSLAYAAKLSDVDIDELGMAISFMSRNATEAIGGSKEMAANFAKIEIPVQALKSMKPDDLLKTIANRFEVLQDGGQKTTIAMELFGRAGTRLIPMLNQGAKGITALQVKAKALGIVFSEEDAKAAEEFNDSVYTLGRALVGLRNIAGIKFVGMFKDIAEAMTSWLLANREYLRTNITEAVRALTDYLGAMLKVIKSVGESLFGIIQIFGGTERAIKLLLGTLSILFAAKILYGIGAMTIAIYGLAAGFAVANAAALTIPLLVGAAIAAVVLLIEDVFSFFQGKKSLTGYIKSLMRDELPNLMKLLIGTWDLLKFVILAIPDALKEVWTWITDIYGFVSKYLAPIFEYLGGLLGKISLPEMAGKFGEKLSEIFGGETKREAEIRQTLMGPVQPTPSMQSKSVVNNQNMRVNAPVTVNVPPGTPPEEAAQAARDGVRDAFDSMLRQAALVTEPAVEW